MKNTILKCIICIFVLLITLLITGCRSETEILNKTDEVSIELKSSGALLEVSYEITTYTRYAYDIEDLTELDLAHLNPSDEKQRVQMFLMPDGTVNMAIEELDIEQTIKIQHEVAPCDLPKTKMTEVVGNTVTFYDGNRKMISSHPITAQRQTELADRIKKSGNRFGYQEAARCFAEMQGGFSDYNTEKMIEKARSNGQITEHCDQFATVRTTLSEFMRDAAGDAVIIVDKHINKVVAAACYDEEEIMTMCTYYGYTKEGEPLLNALRTDHKMEVPSGADVWKTTMSKIENLKFNQFNKEQNEK